MIPPWLAMGGWMGQGEEMGCQSWSADKEKKGRRRKEGEERKRRKRKGGINWRREKNNLKIVYSAFISQLLFLFPFLLFQIK